MPIDRVANHLSSFNEHAAGFVRLFRVVKCVLWLVVAVIAASLGSAWMAATSGMLEMIGLGIAVLVGRVAIWRALFFFRDRRSFSDLVRDEVANRTAFLSPALWIAKRLGVDVNAMIENAADRAKSGTPSTRQRASAAPRRQSRVVQRG